MRILLVDNETSFLAKLQRLLADHDVTTVSWQEPLLEAAEQVDAIVLSGGHGLSVARHPQEFAPEAALIMQVNKPLIGVCLGCELLATMFSARVTRLSHRAKGLTEVTVLRDHPVFGGMQKFDVYESHRWRIQTLPPWLVGYAASSTGYEVIKHVERPLWGLQFHPEMLLSRTAGQVVFAGILRQFEHARHPALAGHPLAISSGSSYNK